AAASPRRIVRRTASGSKISLRSQTAKAIEASTVLTEVPRWLLEVTSPVPLRALRASRTGVFDVPSSSAIDFSVSGLPALYRPERMALLISLAIRSPRDPKRGCTLASSRSWTIVSYTTHNILCSFGWLQRGLLMESREGPESPRLGPTLALPQVSAYLYPWDLVGDPLVVSRLASAGFEHVSVAAAYHSVRAATPQHPQHRFVVAESAAVYRPVRSAAWAGRRLSPFSAPWTGSEDSFERAVEALGAGGLRVTAWVVLTHNSALGRQHRDLVVRNCFGDSRSEEHTSELQSLTNLVCRLLLEKKNQKTTGRTASGPSGTAPHTSRLWARS